MRGMGRHGGVDDGRKVNFRQTYPRLLRYARPYWRLVALILALSVVGAFMVLGIATMVFGVLLGTNGILDGWLNDSPLDVVYGVLILASMIGQFVAVAGVYAWRRADSEGRSTKKTRSMIVVGTLGIAVLGG